MYSLDLSKYKDLEKYQNLVEIVNKKYINDIDRIKYAKEIMPDNFYIQYVLTTLQRKAIHIPMDKDISIKAGDLDNFIRSVLYINDYVTDDVPYSYVVKKSDRFINELIEKLYE